MSNKDTNAIVAEPIMEEQIDKLANFIMSEIEGEPSQDEGAVDTAIRIIKKLQADLASSKLKECEATIKFTSPKEKIDLLYKAMEALGDLGVTFDTGGSEDEEGNLCYDWEFDWSLKGPAKVYFKRFKQETVIV